MKSTLVWDKILKQLLWKFRANCNIHLTHQLEWTTTISKDLCCFFLCIYTYFRLNWYSNSGTFIRKSQNRRKDSVVNIGGKFDCIVKSWWCKTTDSLQVFNNEERKLIGDTSVAKKNWSNFVLYYIIKLYHLSINVRHFYFDYSWLSEILELW